MKQMPIGISDFGTLIRTDQYYVDKTLFIRDVIDRSGGQCDSGKVMLFTRPRRFGKSLNLSMLKYFFENQNGHSAGAGQTEDRNLFEGLNISKAGETYTALQGRFPVIFLSIKDVRDNDAGVMVQKACALIQMEAASCQKFVRMEMLNSAQQKLLMRVISGEAAQQEYESALRILMQGIYETTEVKPILLMDEYDVPLEYAYEHGIEKQVLNFFRNFYSATLKDNPWLGIAVMTGCLRASKESIFTGLNNPIVNTVLSNTAGEYFGFTETEVFTMLDQYGLSDRKEEVKQWYDGYRFGRAEVYNPWSVINYVSDHMSDHDMVPVPYWINTSHNGIVRQLVNHADRNARNDLEILMNGGTIEKKVHEEVTYSDIFEEGHLQNGSEIWNFLFFTGYLKIAGQRFDGLSRYARLCIPNREVLSYYITTVIRWFDDSLPRRNLSELYRNIRRGNAGAVQEEITRQLLNTISFYDYREDYYHGFLAGVLQGYPDAVILSNRESGMGRFDVVIRPLDIRKELIIFEAKIADDVEHLEEACEDALRQVARNHYDADFRRDGYRNFIHYGISFYKKVCMVKAEDAREGAKMQPEDADPGLDQKSSDGHQV